jgi:hypothetical protein
MKTSRATFPDVLVEPLDIDVETLDSALMELLTSDWQPLDDGEAPSGGDAEKATKPESGPSH